MEVTCQTCGQKVKVQSFLAAAQQPCGKCGQLLMGPLDRGTRTARPTGFGEALPSSQPLAYAPSSSAGLWCGMAAGVLVGLGIVIAVSLMGRAIPLPVQGAVLGALSGVLLTPILAVSTFLAMFLPFSLEGVLGDSMWTRIATALHERKLGQLFFPCLIYVVLPMALCGLGGSKMADVSVLRISAGLGAILLGAVAGAVFGSLAGKAR